jgi:RNA polymerase sigma-70 factor (ECF subfamily)
MDAVYRLTSAILGDEADARDATQETFVAAWRQLPRLREPESFEAWLQRVAVNAARMALRARGRRRIREIPSSTVAAMPDRAVDIAGGRPHRDDAPILDAALTTLSVEQRSILVFHHLEGRSLIELAATLDIPVGTAKSRLYAARRALAAAISDEEQRS